jgi:magnesium transporter
VTTPKVHAEILRKLMRAGATGRVERLVDRLHASDVAQILPELNPGELRTVFDILFSAHRAGRTLRELPSEVLPTILEVLDDARVANVLARLAPDDAVALLHALPEDRRERVTTALPTPRQKELDRLLAYPESTAGSVMTTRFLALRETSTAQEAIDAIRRHTEEEVEQVFYLYVTDDEGRLKGVVPIRKLVSCPPSTPIAAVMIQDPVAVQAMADQEEAAAVVAKYNLLAVPVIDTHRRLLGVITVDDVIDVIHEEATEDMFRMVGLSEDEHVFSPMLASIRRRLPWMVVNLATAFLAAWVVGLFESSIRNVVALAVFLPVVAGMGGNGGTQTLTIITRGMALGELSLDVGLRAVLREVVIGVAIGTAVGLLTALGALLWRGQPMLGLVLLIAMVLNMTVAGLSGAAIPLLLKSLGQDPALGSGVIVTTFTDVCGFFFFLGIATLLIGYLS